MPIRTQQDFSLQMLQQLRILDPSISADLGTPERKIIDSVAQALVEAQIDILSLTTGLDIDTKLGTDLDRFLGLFGFARQKGTASTGVVQFSRNEAAPFDIVIDRGTQLLSEGSDDGLTPRALFETTTAVTLLAGETVVAAPIRSTSVGSFTNVGANQILTFVGSPVFGITAVTNPSPTLGGNSPETDNALRVRFKNTVFRNLAGTSDQYLALALAGALTNKANVIGPISRYREYIQVPIVDDASDYDVDGDDIGETGGGISAEYTTALSTIPYSEYTYSEVPAFVSNGETGASAIFWTPEVDFEFNYDGGKDRGDAHRLFIANLDDDPSSATYRPNVTFTNVYEGADEDVEAIRPGDIVLFEHSYVSSASRNDYLRNITNAVDVYINGGNDLPASTVIAAPTDNINFFVDSPTNKYDFSDYRRLGEPDHYPLLGNVFTPLFWSPILSLPESITVGVNTYLKGEHYWPIIDVSDNEGSVRARTGIEWSSSLPGKLGGDTEGGPYTGDKITEVSATSILIEDYTFDRNIIDIQASLEGSKQVTTDILVHKATVKYYKLDLTVMYNPGASVSGTNNTIRTALQTFFDGQSFGTTIQLSDLLQVVHNVGGIDNVRWSYDVDPDRDRVTETNADGVPRLGLVVDRIVPGDGSTNEVQQFYISGSPTGGTYILTHEENITAAIAYDAVFGTIDTALSGAGIAADCVSGVGTPESPFRIEFQGVGFQDLFSFDATELTGGDTVNNTDFFLRDNELPSLATAAQSTDTLPGLVIRPRSQHTWERS